MRRLGGKKKKEKDEVVDLDPRIDLTPIPGALLLKNPQDYAVRGQVYAYV